MLFDLDPRFTFDSFVVGDANRPVVDAARRAAVPGGGDNPLLICGGSGLGKTHLLNAIGHRAQRLHSVEVAFVTLDHLSGRVDDAGTGAAGPEDPLEDTGLLLVDDIQLMQGQREAQERLLRAWDALSARGGQVVLTSDRDVDRLGDLDDRVRGRLAGGLTVDISPPDYETRVAIARRKAEERGEPLADGVCEALARIRFTNIRELKGSLNRLIAIQELEDRTVSPGEVAGLLGIAEAGGAGPAADAGDGAAPDAVDGEAERRLADAIRLWDAEGYRTGRLEGALIGALTPEEAAGIVQRFEADVARLREIESRIRSLEPETADGADELMRDPARIAEAEALLADVRRRRELPPAPPDGRRLEQLGGDSLALRAARAVVEAPGGSYNPLLVVGPAGAGKSTLLIGLAHTLRETHDLVVAYIAADGYAEELVEAVERDRLEEWRARYRRADALLLDDVDRLAGSEAAREELYHLFEDLYRGGRQLVFAATLPPQELAVPDRLRSRLEGGLVVELERRPQEAGAGAAAVTADPDPAGGREADRHRSWLPSREKVLWEWPYAEDWVEESLD